MKKRLISLLAIALVVCTCLPMVAHAADKITITSAKSDSAAAGKKALAECAVENLRSSVEGGLWYMGDTTSAPDDDSDAQPGERYLTLGLSQAADISSIKIQWYQGGSAVDDVKATKQRAYIFRIEASADGTKFTQIYPASGDAKSGKGSDFEEYACTFSNAVAVRVVGKGSEDGLYDSGDKNGERDEVSDKFFAIRNIEVWGTGKGGSGYNAGGSTVNPGSSGGTNTNTPTGGNGGGNAAPTGDFENILLFAGIAVVACAAVVIIRKKIRER